MSGEPGAFSDRETAAAPAGHGLPARASSSADPEALTANRALIDDLNTRPRYDHRKDAAMQTQPMNPPRPAVPGVLPAPTRVESDARDDAMRARIKRLARPHRSGGWVVERASLLAGGVGFDGAQAWIETHGGMHELPAAPRAQPGLHSRRAAEVRAPLRFVLPAGALG